MMSSQIVLIRHARPLPPGQSGLKDSERPLTDEGREIQKYMSESLQERGYTPLLIYHSPLLRAKQTAEILGEVFAAELKEEKALGFSFDPDILFKHIPSPSEEKCVFFVGHEPTLAQFANDLLGQTRFPGFSTSCAAILRFDDEIAFCKAELVDYITPQV